MTMSPIGRLAATAAVASLLATVSVMAQVAVSPPLRPSTSTRTPAQSADSSGLITGRVVDGATDSPVGSALVVLIGTGQTEYNATNRVLTNADGRFYFSGVVPGRYTLTASKPGWLPGAFGRVRPAGAAQPLELRARETRPDVVVRTWRNAVVSGRVTDEASEPVVGANVFIYQQSFAAGRQQFVYSSRAITDDRGQFRFSSLLPGRYVVLVPATVISEPSAQPRDGEAYLRTMTGLGAAPLLRDDIDVQSGSGRLVTSALPVPNAPGPTGAWTTYTSTMAASATTLRSAQVITATAGREVSGVDVQVRYVPTHRVSGTLTDSEGRPANSHAVHLLPADMADYPLFDVATAVTDGAGRFTFFGVPQGDYVARVVRIPLVQGGRVSQCGGTGELSTVCASTFGPNGPLALSADPLLFGEQPVAVTDRDVTGLTIAMRPGAQVSGRVEFEGTSERPTDAQLARVPITLEPAGGPLGRAAGRTFDNLQPGQFLPDGRFAIPSTLPGPYLLRVGALPGGWTMKHATYQGRDMSESAVSLTNDLSGVVITLTDHPGKIAGTVQDPDTLARGGALVILFPVDEAGWMNYGLTSRRVQNTSVNNGTFSFLAPLDGEYRLIAIPDDAADDWQNPAFLKRLVPSSERIVVSGNTAIARPLRVRRIP